MARFWKQFFRQHQRIFITLLILDGGVLLLHLLFARHALFFHLDFEQNLPTIYQSGKLLIFGTVFFFLSISRRITKEIKAFLIPLALAIIFLGLDELFQIHENIYRAFEYWDRFHPSRIVEISMNMGYRSSLWLLYYFPFIALFLFWSGYWLHYFQAKIKDNFWIIVVSSLALFTVLITEILSSTGTYDDQSYFWLITIEETAEMLLGSTLVLVGCKMLNKHFFIHRKT